MNRKDNSSMVLIVDDHPTNLELLVDALSDEGLNVAIAKSGQSALNQAQEIQPDIILLDILMPGIDGFETCRRLKEREATRDIPVIFMTALTDTVNKVKGFEAGGVDYITKPLQIEEVLARLHAHLTIQKLQQQLQEEIRTKNKFFSIIAHDLKSPLIGFMSFAHILEDFDSLNKDRLARLARQFKESAENLYALLNNLLTWSRIQQGIIDYIPQELNLASLVTRSIAILAPNAEQKQIAITHDIPDPLNVIADLDMLDTIIRNVLSNAIKFTQPEGNVEVRAVHDENMVSVIISDTGIGIPDEKLETLFQAGVRTQRKGTAGEKGTGLGLILCKEFIERQGGRIWIESEVGKGTTFRFTIPRPPVSESQG